MSENPEISLVLNRLDDLARLLQRHSTSPWMLTVEAADYLRCSTRQIERLTSQGLLPFHRQDPTSPRSPRLYHRRHLVAYLVAGRNPVDRRLTKDERRMVEDLCG